MRGVEQNQNQTKSNELPRSRALGIIILMFALLLFQVGVFLFEKVFKGVGEDAGTLAAGTLAAGPSVAGLSAANPSAAGRRPELFHFDPNTISPDSLSLLGFSQKQAESIIKYRSKGGKFRKKSDFAKMYVVSDDKYKELEPYIVLPDRDIVHPSHVKHVLRADTLISTPRASAVSTPRASVVSTPRAVVGSRTSLREEHREMPREKRSEVQLNQRLKPQPLLIDINMADSAALTSLYGIGGYYARKIIGYRERLGNFYSTHQLMEIPGIDSTRFEGFARNITADPSDVRRFSLDTAGKSFLIRHPYVGAYAARGILLMREKFGVGACTMENLVKERIISLEMAQKLWFYIENSSF